MPDLELILPSDPIADCITTPEQVVIGSIMENVPVVMPTQISDHINNMNNPHQTTTTQLTDLEDLVLIFENNLI